MQILDGAPEGWRVLHFPGREQSYTIQEYRGYANDRHESRNWRTRGFCKTEREAWRWLKVMAG